MNDRTRYDCPHCSGTGVRPEYAHIQNGRCFPCNGRGWTLETPKIWVQATCRQCDGCGKIHRLGRMVTCTYCQGRGEMPRQVQDPIEYEPNEDGHGFSTPRGDWPNRSASDF